MKHVSILVPAGAASMGCIEGSYKAFTIANDFLVQKGAKPMFKVQLVGLDKSSKVYDQFFKVAPDAMISEITKTDLIIIPAVNGKWKEVVEINKEFFPWIRSHHQKGAEI